MWFLEKDRTQIFVGVSVHSLVAWSYEEMLGIPILLNTTIIVSAR